MSPRRIYDAAVLGDGWTVSLPIADPPRVVIRDRGGAVRWPSMPEPRTPFGLLTTTARGVR